MKPGTKNPTAEQFALYLHTAARVSRQILDRRLKHLGTTQSGWLTIAKIAKASAPMSQRELADLVGIEGPSLVATLDRLERDGLVKRVASPTDRRVKLVSLTEAGQGIFAEVQKEGTMFCAWMTDGLDADALSTAVNVMGAVCQRLEDAL
jgi:MarR family transcriptional regulator for hemolysin